jgi:Amidases related to nicotinamidase
MNKIRKITDLLVQIRTDNNLVKQDLERYVRLVNELKELLKDQEVLETLNKIEEVLVIVDVNNGFTIEGVFQNPYMEALINPINQVAREFDEDPTKIVIALNEGHHENSAEFKTFPEHCKKGTTEALYAELLRWVVGRNPVFEKNTTMGCFAPGYLDFFDLLPNLKKVVFAGGVTDICLFEAALTTKKYFDQNDRLIEVVVDRDLVDTYDAPWHNREEWNGMTEKFLNQAGIETVKQYVKKKEGF